MRNRVGGFEAFLKVPVIIIILFGDNSVLGQIYIDIYINFGGKQGGCTRFILHLSFIIHKNSTSFSSNNFCPRVNNKQVTKTGAKGANSNVLGSDYRNSY